MQLRSFFRTLAARVKASVLRSRNEVDWQGKYQALLIEYHLLKHDNELLEYGNEQLKAHHKNLLEEGNTAIKRDLNEAINIVVDYQKTLFRAALPDPNVQRSNDLFNKWGLKTERVSGMYKIVLDGKDITMGREY